MMPANFSTRRTFLKSATMAAAGCAAVGTAFAEAEAGNTKSLFDGKTLDGWIQVQNSATSIGGGDISDFAALAKKLTVRADPVSAFLNDQLDDTAKAALATESAAPADVKTARSALA